MCGFLLLVQKSDRGVNEPCRQRGATGSAVVSSTLGHRQSRGDACHNGNDAASHRHREAAASQRYLTTELMIKEEYSPHSGTPVFHAAGFFSLL